MRERAEEMERSARLETQVIRDKTADIMAMLDQAIEKSHSVEQIRSRYCCPAWTDRSSCSAMTRPR